MLFPNINVYITENQGCVHYTEQSAQYNGWIWALELPKHKTVFIETAAFTLFSWLFKEDGSCLYNIRWGGSELGLKLHGTITVSHVNWTFFYDWTSYTGWFGINLLVSEN